MGGYEATRKEIDMLLGGLIVFLLMGSVQSYSSSDAAQFGHSGGEIGLDLIGLFDLDSIIFEFDTSVNNINDTLNDTLGGDSTGGEAFTMECQTLSQSFPAAARDVFLNCPVGYLPTGGSCITSEPAFANFPLPNGWFCDTFGSATITLTCCRGSGFTESCMTP